MPVIVFFSTDPQNIYHRKSISMKFAWSFALSIENCASLETLTGFPVLLLHFFMMHFNDMYSLYHLFKRFHPSNTQFMSRSKPVLMLEYRSLFHSDTSVMLQVQYQSVYSIFSPLAINIGALQIIYYTFFSSFNMFPLI